MGGCGGGRTKRAGARVGTQARRASAAGRGGAVSETDVVSVTGRCASPGHVTNRDGTSGRYSRGPVLGLPLYSKGGRMASNLAPLATETTAKKSTNGSGVPDPTGKNPLRMWRRQLRSIPRTSAPPRSRALRAGCAPLLNGWTARLSRRFSFPPHPTLTSLFPLTPNRCTSQKTSAGGYVAPPPPLCASFVVVERLGPVAKRPSSDPSDSQPMFNTFLTAGAESGAVETTSGRLWVWGGGHAGGVTQRPPLQGFFLFGWPPPHPNPAHPRPLSALPVADRAAGVCRGGRGSRRDAPALAGRSPHFQSAPAPARGVWREPTPLRGWGRWVWPPAWTSAPRTRRAPGRGGCVRPHTPPLHPPCCPPFAHLPAKLYPPPAVNR